MSRFVAVGWAAKKRITLIALQPLSETQRKSLHPHRDSTAFPPLQGKGRRSPGSDRLPVGCEPVTFRSGQNPRSQPDAVCAPNRPDRQRPINRRPGNHQIGGFGRTQPNFGIHAFGPGRFCARNNIPGASTPMVTPSVLDAGSRLLLICSTCPVHSATGDAHEPDTGLQLAR